MSKFKVPIIISIIIILLALVKILFLSPKKAEKGGIVDPKAPKPAVMVTGYVLKSELLNNEVYSSGTISANEEAELRSEVSGKIVMMNIIEGSNVQKGQLLVKINDADLRAQLKGLQLQQTLAEEKEARQKKLLEISGISKEEYDISLSALNVIKAEVENMNAQIAKTEIRAPFNGVLGLKKISEGSYVTPATTIVTMQQIDPVKVDFAVPEKYMDKIKKGDKVLFTIQGLTNNFTAKIYAIDPKIDLATRTVQLRAMASNNGGKIFPGAFAKIQLLLSQNQSALMVPTEAVVPVLKGQKVFLYKNGVANEQMVETGLRTPTKIEIVNGLQPGDTVIVNGVMSIKQGTPVKLIK